ncbi:uncharacterized protein IWZ02DRAFT_279711 [Phyllosticta citriasiana]|uniref:Uncharacterized protein n=1 Tax=Phyllosticta citriasiana TaxID=595635 RepID=A0ABR1L166_9PEZI
MGWWGSGVSQSDLDLDILGDLSVEMDVEDLYFPEKPDQIRAKLNDDRLQARLEKLREAERTKKKTIYDFPGVSFAIVLLGAAAMELGVSLGEELKTYMSNVLRTQRLGMYDEAKREILSGLGENSNGTALQLAGKGLIETANEPRPNAIRSIGLNVPSPLLFGGCETPLDGDKKE